jgi:transcriptional regulator with XRE-family HTH domain
VSWGDQKTADAAGASCPRCGGRLRRGNTGVWCGPCQRALATTAHVPGLSDAGHRTSWRLPDGFFQRPEVAAAVQALDFGALFRLVRAALGVSQEALGLAVELDQSRICKVETGAQRLRDVEAVVRVARVLGIPPQLLGFADASQGLDGPAPGDDVWAGPNRRAFVATVTAMALAASTSGSGISVPIPHVVAEPMRRVSAADVDRIETVTQAFREWGFRSGGALSQAALSAQLRTVQETARTAICADAEVRRRLLVAACDLASVTAWSSYDLAHHDRARQLWLVALEASRAADEPDLTATVLRHLAHQALHLDHPRDALQYLRVAHATASDTRRDRCGAVLAEITIYEAWAHASTAHSAGCRRAITLAQEEFASGTRLPVPAWRAHFDAVELAALVGHSLHVLADHEPEAASEAHQVLTDAVAGRTDAYARAGALNLVALAATCFQGGHDLDQGVELGRTAMGAVHQIGSPRVRARAQALLHVTAPYASRADVADLRQLITAEISEEGNRAG